MPTFNRFDIVQAHYWFCVNNHGGQWSRLYARLCRIGRYYKPGILETADKLEGNAREIYLALCAKSGVEP